MDTDRLHSLWGTEQRTPELGATPAGRRAAHRRRTRVRWWRRRLAAGSTVGRGIATSLWRGVRYVWRTPNPAKVLLVGGTIQSAAIIGALLVSGLVFGNEVTRESTALIAVVEAFLLIPVLGYLVVVLQDSLDGGTDPPGFAGWRLVRLGFEVFLITLAFQLFVKTVLALFISAPVDAFIADLNLLFTPGSETKLSALTAYVLTAFLSYVYTAVIVTYARRERLMDVLPWRSAISYRSVLLDRNYAAIALSILAIQVVRMEVITPTLFRATGGLELLVVWLVGGIASFYLLVLTYVLAGDRWETVADGRGDRKRTLDTTVQTTLDVFQ